MALSNKIFIECVHGSSCWRHEEVHAFSCGVNIIRSRAYGVGSSKKQSQHANWGNFSGRHRISCWFAIERFFQRSGGFFSTKMYYIYGKKFPCISQGIEGTWPSNRLSKFSIIIRHLWFWVFFRSYAYYVLRANYAIKFRKPC